jgi:low temperature requirement protein LtrA
MASPTPHRRRRFTGRDPQEEHRTSTPLELLFDLTIVVAFGTAADDLAHFIAGGHAWDGIAGFAFACFGVIWAWVNYSWFASAYDTDDWLFRVATMVQMVGVIVLSLGLPQMFASIEHGETLDNGVMVSGYVVMRVSALFLWSRVLRHDPPHAIAARTYMSTIAIAQIGWVALALVDLPVATTFALMVPLFAIEVLGPYIAERKAQTPWHVEHIVERYGLLVIITLGEVIIGTVAALNALVHGEHGWTTDAVALAVAGVGLAFGCWWVYFSLPGERTIEDRRHVFLFAHGHFLIFGPLAALGAGLHVAAFALEGEAEISDTGVVLSVAIPLALYILAIFVLYALLTRTLDPFHLLLLALSAAVFALSMLLVAAGASVAVCLLALVLVPAVTVVGYETIGHRHMADALERL